MHWQQLKTDPAARARLAQRAAVLKAVRGFFDTAGFLEVETPLLVQYPGMEPNLDVFATELRDERGQAFPAHLITSPEYAMKKLLAAGYDRIYNITKAFRNNEPWDGSHNPEFTMIEWYRSPAEYEAIMADMEQMVAAAAVAVTGGTTVTYQGQAVDLAAPWPRLTVAEAMRQYAGLDLDRAIDDPAWFRAEAIAKGCTVTAGDTWDDVFFKLFLRDVEPRLGTSHCERSEAISPIATSEIASLASGLLAMTAPARPVILCEYPRSMAALALLKPSDARYALRFEAYCCGLELANAFAELNDKAEQRARLEEEASERQRLGRSPWALDEDFLAAVGEMPPASGIALGIDRLVMLLTDAPTIREVLFFPADAVWGKPKQ